MKNYIRPMAEKYQKEHKSKKSWLKVVTALACIVVFCTTYALILPAITWEQSLICEKPEHTHTKDCYELVTVQANKELICELEEHTHSDKCYDVVSVCVCGLEENEEHAHTAECYRTEKVLICELGEHSHDESCYSEGESIEEYVLTCELEEHTHTASCFDAPLAADDGYRCGKVEHTHTEECYFEDGSLRCTMLEHTHTDECRREPDDSEKEENWIKAFESDLKDDPIIDTYTVALSQMEYAESIDNFILGDEGETKGFTRYGMWFGKPYEEWDAMFAAFCLNYAEAEWAPFSPFTDKWMEFLAEKELLTDPADVTPESGYVTFYAERDEETDEIVKIHAAIFSFEAEKETEEENENEDEQIEKVFTLIEGNVKNEKTKVDEVAYVEIDPDDVLGYLVPKTIKPEEDDETEGSDDIETTDDASDQITSDDNEETGDNTDNKKEDDKQSSFYEDPVYDNIDPVITPIDDDPESKGGDTLEPIPQWAEDPEDPMLDPEDETDEDKLEENPFADELDIGFEGPFYAPLDIDLVPDDSSPEKNVSDDGEAMMLTLGTPQDLAGLDLVIVKVVEGAAYGGSFEFTAEVLNGEFTAPDPSFDEYTLDADGTAHFTLRPNESVTLHVPADAQVRINELSGGFYVKYTDGSYNADGPSQTITVSENRTITVHNIIKAPLPSTGSRGTPELFCAIGILILVSEALLYVYIQRRSRERRSKQ